MNQDQLSLLNEGTATLNPPNNNGTFESVESPPEEPDDTPNTTRRWPQYIAALTATLSALSAGLVLGWTSPILSNLQNGTFHNITVNNNQLGWIGSFVTLGGMSMCIPTGFLCDLIGRKRTLLVLIIPFTIGWALIIAAQSVTMLYFGRLITGMAAGASCVAAPLYVSEIAQKEIRGTLGSYFQLMVTVGVFLAYLFGEVLPAGGYTLLCAVFPVFFFVLMVFQPETPLFCLRRGRYSEALRGLVWLRGVSPHNERDLAEIEGALKDSLESNASFGASFKRKANLKAFLIAFALMFFQQFCGINAVILYTSDIFKSSGVQLDPNVAAIIVGACQAAATFVSSLVVDKTGRRFLLILSSFLMALSTLSLAIFFTLKFRVGLDAVTLGYIAFVPVVSLCFFVVVYSLGLGPIPWMIAGEIFRPEVKSIASSGAGTFNWFLAFIITKFYLQVTEAVGEDSTFYGFSVFSVLGGVFVYFVVPETKGRSVEEVQEELEAD